MIDDGLHQFESNDLFLCNSHHKLKKNGIYVVEDVLPYEVESLCSNISKYRQWFSNVKFLRTPSPLCEFDNSLFILQK